MIGFTVSHSLNGDVEPNLERQRPCEVIVGICFRWGITISSKGAIGPRSHLGIRVQMIIIVALTSIMQRYETCFERAGYPP